MKEKKKGKHKVLRPKLQRRILAVLCRRRSCFLAGGRSLCSGSVRDRSGCFRALRGRESMPRKVLHPFNRGSLQTGVRFISTTSHITAVTIDKTQTSDPSDSLYIYIYIYRMNILHIGTLNSKLLHFGQELQFDRGGSFDE